MFLSMLAILRVYVSWSDDNQVTEKTEANLWVLGCSNKGAGRIRIGTTCTTTQEPIAKESDSKSIYFNVDNVGRAKISYLKPE